MKVGDFVKTKGITSPPVNGVIVGLVRSDFFLEKMMKNCPMDPWDRAFPTWQEYEICIVKKFEASIPLFPDEILKHQEQGMDVEKRYTENSGLHLTTFPREELELIRLEFKNENS